MGGNGEEMQRLIHDMLKELGEDPTREGLERTPARVAKAWEYLTAGYRQNVNDVLNEALFTEEYDEMVVVKDIDFYSLCEHHLLPFFGKCHIAYMPSHKIVGLSKLPRLVEMYSDPLYDVGSIKRAIVRFMLIAEKSGKGAETVPPQVETAKKHLAMLRETDPKTVKAAERYFFD